MLINFNTTKFYSELIENIDHYILNKQEKVKRYINY